MLKKLLLGTLLISGLIANDFEKFLNNSNYEIGVAGKIQTVSTQKRYITGQILTINLKAINKDNFLTEKLYLSLGSEINLGRISGEKYYYGFYFTGGPEYYLDDYNTVFYTDLKIGISKITEVSNLNLNYGINIGIKYLINNENYIGLGYTNDIIKFKDGRKSFDGISFNLGYRF